MDEIDKNRSGAERRRAERFIVNLPAQVLIKGRRVTCQLLDISETGALVETSGEVAIGDRVSLDLPKGGPTIGTVVRVSANHIAMAFPGIVVISQLVEPARRK
jgi:PilZ domain